MVVNTCSLSESQQFSYYVIHYTEKNELTDFYNFPPNLNGIKQALEKKSLNPESRKTLSKALHSQYINDGIEVNKKLQENILLLEKPDTFTITTGHQLNIFLGPLYYFYKIISTINLAKQVEKECPGKKMLPIFWMASEDHDFKEIASINLFNNKVEWKGDYAGPVGRINPKEIQPTLDELASYFKQPTPYITELFDLFKSAYLESNSLSGATRKLVHHFFQDTNLLILDGDDSSLKSLFAPIMKRELTEKLSNQAVEKTNAKLEKQGYSPQAHSREINLFYIQDNLRERIVLEGNTYKVLNTDLSFSEEKLLEELTSNPDNFSPNVILRPVYQEAVLPNLAYVGGGGELTYWGQLKGVFEQYDIQMPVVILRDSVLWIDKGSQKKIKKFELEYIQLFSDIESLVKSFVNEKSEEPLSLEKSKGQLQAIFEDIKTQVTQVDGSLQGKVDAELAKTIKELDKLEKRLTKAQKDKFENSINQLRKLHEKLFPKGGLQERHDNFISLYQKHGKDFLTPLFQHLDPLNKEFKILIEE